MKNNGVPPASQERELATRLRFLALRLQLGHANPADLQEAASFLRELAAGKTLQTLSGTERKGGRPSYDDEDFAIAYRVEELKLSPDQYPQTPYGQGGLGLGTMEALRVVTEEMNELLRVCKGVCRRPHYSQDVVYQAWLKYRDAAQLQIQRFLSHIDWINRPDEDIENLR